MFEAWERFEEIVQKCQHSRIELWMQLQDFWDGLTPASRRTLRNAAGGPLIKKTPEEIVTILDELFEDANQWPSKIAERRRSTSVYQVDANTSVHVHLDAMAKEIRKLILASIHSESHAACHICGRGHPTHECQASIEEVNAIGNYNFNAMAEAAVPTSTFHSAWLEDLIKSFIVKTDERLDAHGAAIKELGTGLRNLEKQVGQIAIVLSERISSTLPVDTKRNPKETINALKNEVDKEKKGKKRAEKKKKEETSRMEESNESEHMPALPFSQKLYRERLDKQFERFLEMLRQEILIKKRKIKETSVVKRSTILQNKLPQKKLGNELGEIRFHSDEYGGEQGDTPNIRKTILTNG
ncbi:uncharacterized protein [Nicotiana tomentosiformis]|uniref:uncharacterized protein n=1 Tax=Nicotiana tomentosiformis TaxID=4098 RepID=UPI00388C73E6